MYKAAPFLRALALVGLRNKTAVATYGSTTPNICAVFNFGSCALLQTYANMTSTELMPSRDTVNFQSPLIPSYRPQLHAQCDVIRLAVN